MVSTRSTSVRRDPARLPATAHRACRDAPQGRHPAQAADGLDTLDQRPARPSTPASHRPSSLSRCPAGSAPSPGCGWSRHARPASGETQHACQPPPIEPVEMPAGSAPSQAADGLDTLDQRPARPSTPASHRPSSLSRCPARSAPSPGCGWSRHARPASGKTQHACQPPPIEPVEMPRKVGTQPRPRMVSTRSTSAGFSRRGWPPRAAPALAAPCRGG